MWLLAQIGGPTALFLLALVAMIGILLMRSGRYFSRTGGAASGPVRAPRAARQPAGVPPDELARWEVQMHDTARDLSAQLDSKMAALGHLVQEADRAASRLEQALAAAQSAATSDAQEQEAATPSPPATPGTQAAGLSPTAGGSRSAAKGGPGRDDEPADRSTRDRRRQEIYTLADYGFEAGEIARRLDTPVGEVELILGLRPK
jgi:hypothetical protein